MRVTERLWAAFGLSGAEPERVPVGSNNVEDLYTGTVSTAGTVSTTPTKTNSQGFPGVVAVLRALDEIPVRLARPEAGATSAIQLADNLWVTRGAGDRLVLVSVGVPKAIGHPNMFINKIPVLRNAVRPVLSPAE